MNDEPGPWTQVCLWSWSLCHLSKNYFADIPQAMKWPTKVTQLIGTKTEIQIYSSPSHALCMIPCCLLQSHKISFCLGVPTLGPEPTVVPAHRLWAWNHAWLFSAPSPGSWVPESVLAGVTPVHGQIFPKEDKSLLGSKECKQDFPLQTHRPLKMRSKLPHPFGCYVGSLWLPCS